VEQEFRPRMLAELQRQWRRSVRAADRPCAAKIRGRSWLARFGRLKAPIARYHCPGCHVQCRPLLDLLGVEPGRISGSLARLLALLAE
jgi:hypothetical protein